MDSLLQYSSLTERLSSQLPELAFPDDNNNNDDFESSVPAKEDKYSLRPRSMRRMTESAKESLGEITHRQSKPHKPKQKAAPLSKYRRKTANARERNRMREINTAFETLRRIIPHMQATHMPGTNEKLTKITTLRLAMKYISTLSAALNGSTELESLSDYSDFDCLFLESDGESISDHSGSLLTSPDFPEPSLSPVDFSDPSLPALLHTDFTEHSLEHGDFSDFLLT
ncbi:helix-loop-helix protein delilah-like [Diabrotica virgifera virgifera]|uniref:Helix-loop-helix protein delilah-like n=1 Tax=Diabrotica virgifera virgifera TaxID=50390 RepID=A0A6P7GHV6_DIAVI|nr:helix-loop-helix protein delilah-like [Diabrotica virgifera virgifera]